VDPPDPPATLTDEYFRYTLRIEKGEVKVVQVERVKLEHPSPAARRLGRFAFELRVGDQLLERVRFDFPLLAASQEQGEDEFEAGLSAQTRVMVPWVERARVVQVLDRKTRKQYPISWPPDLSSPSGQAEEQQEASPTDAGAAPGDS
jgi:hypothetical protein